MPDDTLLLLAKEIRAKTFKVLSGVTESEARFAPNGLNNSIVWHAGHAFCVVEALSVSAATARPPQYPEGWFQLFSWESRPTPQTKYPPLSTVTDALRIQLDRLVSAIEPLNPEQLNRIVDPAKGRTVRYNILHGLHDEAVHSGEIWLLRKLQKPNAP